MRYITIKNVRPGMKLARPLLDEQGNILLREGNLLSTLVYNRVQGMEIQGLYIDDEISEGIVPLDLIDPIEKRIAMKNLMNGDLKKVLSFTNMVVDELKRKRTLQVNVIDIKNTKNYTYKHCVSCCIYATVVGVAMGLTEEQLKNLAVAAIYHDIGKLGLPEEILHKKGKLTDEEREVMRTHPQKSYEKLTEIPEISSVSRNAVLYHHENIDGSGYYGIKEEQQTIVTRILRLVDTYDALTSQRKYRPAYSPSEAIEYIMGNAGTLYDKDVVAAFISKFPLYPVGTTVRLSNNEQGIIYSNEINNIRPVIRLLDGSERLIDLSTDISYRNVIIIGLE